MKLNFGPLSCSMRRDALTDVCKPVVTVKDETRVWLGCISAVLFENGCDVRGTVAGWGVGGVGKSQRMG